MISARKSTQRITLQRTHILWPRILLAVSQSDEPKECHTTMDYR